jgi:hypothetical protein
VCDDDDDCGPPLATLGGTRTRAALVHAIRGTDRGAGATGVMPGYAHLLSMAQAGQIADWMRTLAVLVPRAGVGLATVLQLPRQAGAGRKLVLDVIEYDAAGKVQLLGRAVPGLGIEARLGDQAAGRGVAATSGAWAVVLDRQVPQGRYRLLLEARDGQGRSVARLAIGFNRVAPPEGAVAVDIQPGNNLWRIAQHSYGDGLRYTEIYQANRTQIRDPNLIYPGQIFAVPSAR